MERDDVNGSTPMIQVDLPDIQVTTKKRSFDLAEVLDIGESTRPHQPIRFKFPYRTYGIKIPLRRAFQPTWFSRWRWIHYDETRDLAFCHLCVRAVRHHGDALTRNGCGEATFLSTGYCNWKEASIQTRGFSQHENSLFHLKCIESLRGRLALPKNKNAKSESQRLLKSAAENIRMLARQGIPLQVRLCASDGAVDLAATNADGNFAQLMRLTGNWDSEVTGTAAFLTPALQKELLGIMALEVLHAIAADIRENRHFAVIVDELTDVDAGRRVALRLRWADQDFLVHEDFVGLHSVRDDGADSLTEVVRDALVHLNLNLTDCRGLGYRGRRGAIREEEQLIRQLQTVEPRVILTVHRHGHSLNAEIVEAWDEVFGDRAFRDFLYATSSISGLLEFTPDRRVVPRERVHWPHPPESSSGHRSLRLPRWRLEADQLGNVLENYGEVQRVLEETHADDSDTYLRICHARAATRTFAFPLLLRLAEKIIRVADNLSRALQHPDSRASDGHAVTLTVATLHKMRAEESFRFLWSQTLAFCGRSEVDVDQPATPRQCRISTDHHQSPEDYYRCVYLNAIDGAVRAIEERFGCHGYRMFDLLESLLLKSAASVERESELRSVLDFYGGDFDAPNLRLQLELLETAFDGHRDRGALCRKHVDSFLIDMKPAQRCLFSEVCTLLRLVLLAPATDAASDPGTLQSLLDCHRSMSAEPSADNLLLMHAHQRRCDALCLWRCLNTFVDGDDSRLCRFGKFKRHFCCLANP